MFEDLNFASTYHDLLARVMLEGKTEHNARTGHEIRILEGGTSFVVDLRVGYLPVPNCRKFRPTTAAAEIAWFISGKRSPEWLEKYTKIWSSFKEADGSVNSYGYRWREAFGRDQLGLAIEALDNNPSDRRIYISAWDPMQDGLGAPSKNVPCPVGFTLSVTEGRLSSTLLIRSSDVFVGLPYDVLGHAMLMYAVANSLTRLGQMTILSRMQVCIAHPHIYDSHWDLVPECLNVAERTPVIKPFMPPAWSVYEIEKAPDEWIADAKSRWDGLKWPDYSPRPELIL